MTDKRINLGILSFGNIIEWYDFSLYIYFASDIGREFFPSKDHFISYLLALTTFFLGSMARPLGGLVLGWLGDRYNHRWVINIAVIVMGVSTFAVALLPTYKMVGVLAPILLITLRILQGLSAGGQFPGLLTIAVKDFHRTRGFAVGLVFSISTLGFLLGSIVAFTLSEYFVNNLHGIAWRVPFALSGVFFCLYLYLSHKYKQQNTRAKKAHIKRHGVFISLVEQWRAILAVVLLTTMAASLYYLVFTYFVDYRIKHLGVSKENAFLLNSVILLLACLLYPSFGKIADKVGYLKVFLIAAVLLLVSVYPLLMLLKSGNTSATLIALVLFTLYMAAIQGAISPLFAVAFADEWIATGCAFAYSIGNGLSGGAPLLAETLLHYNHYGLNILITMLLLLGFLGIWLIAKPIREKKQTQVY